MSKISELYSEADYEVRLKAPILRSIILFFLSLLTLTLPRNIMRGEYYQLIPFLVAIVFFIYLLSLIKKGRYLSGALLFSYFMTVVMILNVLSFPHTELAYYRFVLITVLNMAVSLMFTPGMKHLIIQYTVGLSSYILYIVYSLTRREISEMAAPINDQIFLPSLLSAMIVVLFIIIRINIDRVTGDARLKITESEKQTAKMMELVSRSAVQLDEARTIMERSEEASTSISQIEQKINTIAHNSGSLDRQFHVSSQSLTRIGESLTSLDSISENQSANFIETSAALEQMVMSIRNSAGVIETKQNRVAQLKEKAADGASVIRETTSSFDQVSRHIDSIKGMTKTISEISTQTNLLAMNAAIEAAHAGERGRGFAVVAGEVRKLAESSAVSTLKIGTSLEELIKAIQSMGEKVAASGEAFSSISGEVDDVKETMDEFAENIRELSKGSEEILQATGRMNELTMNVVDAVKSVRTNETAVSGNIIEMGSFVSILSEEITEILTATGTITHAMKDLSRKAGKLNSYTRELNKKIQTA